MKFTDIPKECPKAWELFVSDFCSKHIHFDEVEDAILSDFDASFGYLLKFFSSHGIEIERFAYWRGGKYWIDYTVKCTYDTFDFDTPEEAVAKAFEILEEK